MQHLLNGTTSVNGGLPVINGRGLSHLKMTDTERLQLAADLASGQVQFRPSLNQVADLTGVPGAEIRAELKRRSAQETKVDEIDLVTEIFAGLPDEARQEVFRRIGPAKVWDTLATIIT
jgi:hypothetical protein